MKDRIKRLRKHLDLTQQEFAGKIGMSANVLTNYETGRRNPSKSVINNICKTFHVNEEWLKDGIGEMFADMSRDEQIAEFVQHTLAAKPDSFQRRFAAMLSTLSDSDWEVLERMTYAIIEGRGSSANLPAEKGTAEPEPIATIIQPGYSSREEMEAEARAEAERYYEQVLSEKLQASQASSAKEPGAG